MNSQSKSRAGASKPTLKHVASLPAFNIRDKSRSAGRKTSKYKRFDKCCSRPIFPARRVNPLSKSTRPQTRPKKSMRKSKASHGKKSSYLLKSAHVPQQHAYYNEYPPKEDKVKSSCFLSTHSKYSMGRMLASTRHNLDSERTLSRNNSRAVVEFAGASPLMGLLTRTHNILNNFRKKCSQLQKSNRKLRQQLLQRRA